MPIGILVGMHGCSSGSILLVNAEVDSMGGVVEGGVGVDTKTSPRWTAIEKAQAQLRQEFDVVEETRRELEFLVKGGDPLDFKLGNVASVSVQSTSLTDKQHEQFVTSEVKCSFALPASPHGDSVESSGRPGAPLLCEPNSADNLMLFDCDNEAFEGERNNKHHITSKIAPSKNSSHLDGGHNTKEFGDSATFVLPKKAYRRRFRPRPNRDGARSSSIDALPSRGSYGSSLPSRHCPGDVKRLSSDVDNHKDEDISSNCNSKDSSSNASMLKTAPSDVPLRMEPGAVEAVESTGLTKGVLSNTLSDVNASKCLQDNQHNQCLHSGALETSMQMASEGQKSVGGREDIDVAGLKCSPSAGAFQVENQSNSGELKGFGVERVNRKDVVNDGKNSLAACITKAFGSEVGNDGSEMHTKLRGIDTQANTEEKTLVSERNTDAESDVLVKANNETKTDESGALVNDDCTLIRQSDQLTNFESKISAELSKSGSSSQKELKYPNSNQDENASGNRFQGSSDLCFLEIPLNSSSVSVPDGQETGGGLKLVNKADEDSILEEARTIEAKRKRIAELSLLTSPIENHRKSHWDYVLEEMAWLANDFAQERIWKITAAAQLCRRAAFTSQLRFEQQKSLWKQKRLANTLAKAVTEFWHSIEVAHKDLDVQSDGPDFGSAVQGYAVKFLKYNGSHGLQAQVEAPLTPERISELLNISWKDDLPDENLFYTLPPGATEIYQKSIQSHLLQNEKKKADCSMQEEVETSAYDAEADFESQENVYEEEEGETSTYYMPGISEGSRPSKFAHKKRKNLSKAYGARSYEWGPDLPFVQGMENKVSIQQSVLSGKRPASSLNVSIPTKRVRTASRQRVVSPFNAGASGSFQLPNKTDASSGDTSSFQDDQSTLHGGPHMVNSFEFESMGDFEKQLPFDSAEVSTKPKKKKKAKHLGSTYEHRWQLDSNFQSEQRDYPKKRSESHQLESNGSNGLFGQHISKKQKMMRQSLDNSFDNLNPMAGSIPSPVASQLSNMSNPNKFIKMLGGRDRGRKAKALKMPAGQPGSGNSWSLFEDQALVVLVHDMGPNWELISDAINSTLHFKYVFRNAKECRERHKNLMDGTAGDGTDSAEDSGYSQPYPSTLPGIPKGSARQLFQHLQGPMEEDTLKSHFEKIILLGRRQHLKKSHFLKDDNLDSKQLQPPHSSHAFALSQACPNNLSGGPVLTPLDLCDATASNPDVVPIGYQGPHTTGLAISNQCTGGPMLPASGANSTAQVSSNMILGNNLPSPSCSLNTSVRDGRYGVPRSSLSVEEQHRMRQYNQMLSGRNLPQSGVSVPGALPGTDRGVRMLPGGTGMGIMGGLNRGMPIARPGYQGIASSPMHTSGSMLSSGMMAMPSPVGVHPGAGSGPGNSMLRPRDSLHMASPGQNSDPQRQRQTMAQELQMQVPQGNSNTGVPPFGGLTSSFSNQTVPPPQVQSFPLHQQPHQIPQSHHPHHPHLQVPNQNQAYAIRFAKDGQLQPRFLQQQQQQYATSQPLMPPHVQVQPQSQIPISSSMPVASSPLTPMSQQQQQKHQMQQPPHGLGRNGQTAGSGMNNHMGKQRQRQIQQQQFQQAGRHPQQRQQAQTGAKPTKGVGRGNMTMHQNLPVDPSPPNGQGLYLSSGMHPVQQSKTQPPPPHSSSSQQKMSSKPSQQMPSHSDSGTEGHIPSLVASSPALPAASQQAAAMGSASHQQKQPQPKQQLLGQTQTLQRIIRQNSDPPSRIEAQDVINSSETSTGTMPQSSVDVINAIPASSTNTARQKVSDPSYDPNSQIPATPLDSVGAPTRQPSGNLSSIGQSSQRHSHQQKLPSQPHSLQQTQLLQPGNNGLYVRPTNTRPE